MPCCVVCACACALRACYTPAPVPTANCPGVALLCTYRLVPRGLRESSKAFTACMSRLGIHAWLANLQPRSRANMVPPRSLTLSTTLTGSLCFHHRRTRAPCAQSPCKRLGNQTDAATRWRRRCWRLLCPPSPFPCACRRDSPTPSYGVSKK